LPEGSIYVGLAPGAGGQHKRWPLERFIALAKEQTTQGRAPVFVLGPAEADLAPRLRAEVPQALVPASDPASGRAGSHDPAFTIAIGQRLAVAVANDAGVGHLLAAADVPLVSLFGPTRPEKFAPAAKNLTLIRAQDYGGQEMSAIPVAAVAGAVERCFRS
jgi:ADP-heptose:LPS heptosyltransferase